MVGNSGLEHEVSDFHGRHALLNTVVVGTYLRLVANGSHDLAAAWLGSAVTFDESAMPLRKRGAYSKTRRPVLRMTLQPMSSIVADRIGAGLEEIRAAVREFSSDSHGDLDLKTAVWVELADPVVPTSEARVADIRAALQRGGKSTAQHLVEFDELIERSTLAWSSYASQRVQHLAIADASDDELARGTTLLKSISEDLWRAQVELTTGYLNNISFASRAPGPELIASAAASSVLASASKKWRVGIIVPGGNAARSDIEQVEKHQGLLCDVRTVPRGSSDFAARIASALPSMQAGNDAILIAFGGGPHEELAKVRNALEPHLEAISIPCWVAVGHASDAMSIANDLVRVCRTPSDARSLILAETVDYERKFGRVLEGEMRDLIEGKPQVGARKRIIDLLDNLDRELKVARQQHLQAVDD